MPETDVNEILGNKTIKAKEKAGRIPAQLLEGSLPVHSLIGGYQLKTQDKFILISQT